MYLLNNKDREDVLCCDEMPWLDDKHIITSRPVKGYSSWEDTNGDDIDDDDDDDDVDVNMAWYD